MRFLTLTAILAAFLASPSSAADRPVGPETGQLGGGTQANAREPDDAGFPPVPSNALFARGFADGAEISHHDADGTRRCVERFGWRFCY